MTISSSFWAWIIKAIYWLANVGFVILFSVLTNQPSFSSPIWCQFHQHFSKLFTPQIQKVQKKPVKSWVFCASGICGVKALSKMLVKLTPGLGRRPVGRGRVCHRLHGDERAVVIPHHPKIVQVSIWPTFYENLLHTRVVCAAFLLIQFCFVIFWHKNIGAKAVHKL
jgi:hypothetical protein